MMYLPGLEHLLDAGVDDFGFIEVEPQTISVLIGREFRLRRDLVARLRETPIPKLVHGVGAPVAGTTVEQRMLAPFYEAVDVFDPPWATEHLTFTRVRSGDTSWFTGFMLPALQTEQSISVAVRNIRRIREKLEVPFAFETPVNYLRPRDEEMSDGAFIAAIARRADCGILLDIHNLWCNEQNGRQPVLSVLEMLDLEKVWEMHIAAGREVDGYWVDAHSGLIQQPVWDLANQVVPYLPNLKAITFESMPEYLWSGGVTQADIAEEMGRLKHLWSLRAGSELKSHTEPPRSMVSTSTISPQTWEKRLGAIVARRRSSDPLSAELARDPGVDIYRKLSDSVRGGVIVDSLRLTYRLLVLTLGEEAAEETLWQYLLETSVRQLAIDETRQFAEWIEKAEPDVEHLASVVGFELAMIEVSTLNEARTVAFDCDPVPLLKALGAGNLPEATGLGDYSLELTP